MARVSAMLGKPFQPWQHYVWDTALEVDPDTGLLVYGEVGLTLPRQQGKTLGCVSLMAWRCNAWPKQIIRYAAQTLDEAIIKFRTDHIPMLLESPISDRFVPSLTKGSEHLKWDNGSLWGVQATTKKSGHGPTLDMGFADEYWSQVDDRIRQAWMPAMMTRANSQFWWASTVGPIEDGKDSASTEMNASMDAGRLDVEAGLQVDRAYFEWSAPPDADPADPATWWGCMPALGHTVTEGKIRAAQRSFKNPQNFARAYCNQRPQEAPEVGPVDLSRWESLADPRSMPVKPFAFGVEVGRFQESATIALVAMRGDGLEHWEVMAAGDGVEWLIPKLVEFCGRWRPVGVGVDMGADAGSLRPALLRAGFRVWSAGADPKDRDNRAALLTVPTMREVGQATGDMLGAIQGGRGRWLGPEKQMILHRAVVGARTRPLAEAQAWARRGSTDISPLVAITLARWVYALRAPAYDLDNWDVEQSVY